MKYPAQFTPAEEGGLLITFPDFPEILIEGAPVEDSLKVAQEALETAIQARVDSGKEIPVPSETLPGQQ